MLSVDSVVRPHHRPGSTIAHGGLESREIYLVQCAVAALHIYVHAVLLLVVESEMLYTCSHSV